MWCYVRPGRSQCIAKRLECGGFSAAFRSHAQERSPTHKAVLKHTHSKRFATCFDVGRWTIFVSSKGSGWRRMPAAAPGRITPTPK
jgi:hypothetical protein